MTRDESIVLTRAQVREVDRRAIEVYGIPGIVLMENAGRSAAELILRWVRPDRPVAVVCGRGNNGGDGFVIARHLFNAGVGAELFAACDLGQLTGDATVNARIVARTAIPCHAFDTIERINQAGNRLRRAAVIVDAVLGTGFSGEVRPPLDGVIEAINTESRAAGAMVVAVDVPSGLDCDTGLPCNATVRAAHTITFAARKTGFDAPGAAAYTGQVHVADIGAPYSVIQEVLAGGASG